MTDPTTTEGGRLQHGDLAYTIVGSAFEVLRELGHGLGERPYANALVVELGLRNLRCEEQRRFEVMYKGIQVSEVTLDLIVDDAVVVETKVIDEITPFERGQMYNHLRLSGYEVGLIFNFKKTKLEWERIVR